MFANILYIKKYICKIDANLTNIMKKSVYYSEISALVAKKRQESSYSVDELAAYHAGEMSAYKFILEKIDKKTFQRLDPLKISRLYVRDFLITAIQEKEEALRKGRKLYKKAMKELDELKQGGIFNEHDISKKTV